MQLKTLPKLTQSIWQIVKPQPVVHHTDHPLRAAKMTRTVVGRDNPIDLSEDPQEPYVPDRPGLKPSIPDLHTTLLMVRIERCSTSSSGPYRAL